MRAKITYYDIERFGFYKRGQQLPGFGGIRQSLPSLVKWASDSREFEQTTTYQADPDKDVYRTFFCNWSTSPDGRDAILVLWNEHPNNNGKIYGYDKRNRPGETRMVSRDFSNSKAIPGLPSYFWFATDLNILASIRLHYSCQGKGNLDRYINGFLEMFSPYKVANPNNETIGYSKTGTYEKDCEKFHPRFVAHATKNKDIRELLMAERSNITRMVKKETFNDEVKDRRQFHERFFSGLTGTTPKSRGNTTITQILSYTPSEEELEEMLCKHENHDFPREVADIGFYLKNNKKIMLSGTTLSTSEEISLPDIDDAMHSPAELLNALPGIRNHLLLPTNTKGDSE